MLHCKTVETPMEVNVRIEKSKNSFCDKKIPCRQLIPWSSGGERIYAAVGGACLLQRAGELSVVEYGLDRVLQTVRTERVNPHVLSVRINEGRKAEEERKHFAYLLTDRRLLLLILLQLGPWWHEARVDWLELTESGHLLLFRHTRRRLALLCIDTGEKEIIASGVSFVQWIENSDAVVAQTPTHLLIWLDFNNTVKTVYNDIEGTLKGF
ncbi:unnamed protein product [Danaus chrysippus]|uniref:(African queen) hypothetical protein n=1 Tax=Danaus chrysippus TaxID=151541 RepID=A0A8J2R2T0_9NEOP|nr:unnamed protein product [Danaus chrysippus]